MILTKQIYKLEVLGVLKWYFESKNLSLKNALKFRTPLSTENQAELRLYYSQYFVSLVSATEFLFDNKYSYRKEFAALLYEKFIFEDNSNGKENYLYLKELRNSIVHRGCDVLSASHFLNDFPLIIAPLKIQNQTGSKEYSAFSFYLIELIDICENYIGRIIAEHLNDFAEKLPVMTDSEMIDETKKFVLSSEAVPDWVKEHTLAFIDSEDFLKVKIDKTQEILSFLSKSALPHLIGEWKSNYAD